MNSHTIRGKFNELKGDFKKKWAELTDDDWKHVSGSKDKLLGMLQLEIWPHEGTSSAGNRRLLQRGQRAQGLVIRGSSRAGLVRSIFRG